MSSRAFRQHNGNNLDCFPQSHFISDDASKALAGYQVYEMNTISLIRIQLAIQPPFRSIKGGWCAQFAGIGTLQAVNQLEREIWLVSQPDQLPNGYSVSKLDTLPANIGKTIFIRRQIYWIPRIADD